MNYKTKRQFEEWHSYNINPRLRAVLLYMDYWLQDEGYELVITSIHRSREEQIELTAQMAEHEGDAIRAEEIRGGKRHVQASLHELWRAADVQTSHLPDDLIREFEDHVNKFFPYGKEPYNTVFYHRGTAEHFHVQVRHIS